MPGKSTVLPIGLKNTTTSSWERPQVMGDKKSGAEAGSERCASIVEILEGL